VEARLETILKEISHAHVTKRRARREASTSDCTAAKFLRSEFVTERVVAIVDLSVVSSMESGSVDMVIENDTSTDTLSGSVGTRDGSGDGNHVGWGDGSVI
jgi:hypothetical protein